MFVSSNHTNLIFLPLTQFVMALVEKNEFPENILEKSPHYDKQFGAKLAFCKVICDKNEFLKKIGFFVEIFFFNI
jgi:hypothetical protein